jgi:hypothetical protein
MARNSLEIETGVLGTGEETGSAYADIVALSKINLPASRLRSDSSRSNRRRAGDLILPHYRRFCRRGKRRSRGKREEGINFACLSSAEFTEFFTAADESDEATSVQLWRKTDATVCHFREFGLGSWTATFTYRWPQ